MVGKECRICKEMKVASHYYKNKSNKDGLHSYCKECFISKSKKRQKDNQLQKSEYDKKRYEEKDDYYKDKAIKWNNENADKRRVNFKNWQNENKDKLKEYREKRQLHKNHDISEEELALIYKYSSSSCMYCGISEEDSITKYNQRLHKDHAINNGSDGIDNCVLACRICNSSKHDKDWDVWYPSSKHFNQERYEVIEYWLKLWEDNDVIKTYE